MHLQPGEICTSPTVSVVIPTCNRKQRLLRLLQNLHESTYPLHEIIITDSGEDRLDEGDFLMDKKICVKYLPCEKSVCIQRNKGINEATGEWIFLCDDDIEVPPDYIQKLFTHINHHPEAGAVSGLVLQKDGVNWEAKYPTKSTFQLLWKYIFGLSMWGEIECSNNLFTTGIIKHYKKKGNHISKSGWPVITNFSGDYFLTPVYGLGASLIKREWLLHSPYDDVLDSHGLGDNYGVAAGFPSNIHIYNPAFVFHHHAPENRLAASLLYYRRILALDYFRRRKKQLGMVKKRYLLWSLTGNMLSFAATRNWRKLKATIKLFGIILFNKNPYYTAALKGDKKVSPSI